MSSDTKCPCPICNEPGRRIAGHFATFVDYFRCEPCGHVWTVPKEECVPTQDVTAKTGATTHE